MVGVADRDRGPRESPAGHPGVPGPTPRQGPRPVSPSQDFTVFNLGGAGRRGGVTPMGQQLGMWLQIGFGKTSKAGFPEDNSVRFRNGFF